MHYNLGAFLKNSQEKSDLEDSLLESLYLKHAGVTHSGEHGGLGSKNLAHTVTYMPFNLLQHFHQQCHIYNHDQVLQRSRLNQFLHLLKKRDGVA